MKKQAKEIKSLRAQLSEVQQENQKLKGGIFGKAGTVLVVLWMNYFETCCPCLLDLLIGWPEEEVDSFSGNLLKELSKAHERARRP